MTQLTNEDKFNECFSHLSREYVFNQMCRNILDKMSTTYRIRELDGIITNDNIQNIWKNFPDYRLRLLNLIIATATQGWDKHPSLSKQDALQHLEIFFSDIDQAEDDSHGLYSVRACNASLIEPNFDWVKKFKEHENDSVRANLWRSAALQNSRDKSVFSYFYSRIKNGKGSIDEKREVLEYAIKANSLPEDVVQKISESAPISLRRIIVNGLREMWSSLRRTEIYGTPSQVNGLRESKDRLQKLALLFATVDDYNIIDNLSEMLEPSNLSWIVGNAAKYQYISQSIARRMSTVQ